MSYEIHIKINTNVTFTIMRVLTILQVLCEHMKHLQINLQIGLSPEPLLSSQFLSHVCTARIKTVKYIAY